MNKPIIINNIDDFHKYFGNPDNSLLLKMRKIKIHRLQCKIEEMKKEKYKYIKEQNYERASEIRDGERHLLNQVEIIKKELNQ